MNEAETASGLADTPGYRYAEVVGDQLFVAGQVPNTGDSELVEPGHPGPQATQCLKNLMTLVEVHGFSPDDVRHLTIYVVGPHENLLEAWDQVTAFFEQSVPPATLLGVSQLGYAQQMVEVDATIVRAPN